MNMNLLMCMFVNRVCALAGEKFSVREVTAAGPHTYSLLYK